MKKSIAFAFIFQFSILSSFAQSLSGYEIMKKADEVPEPVTASQIREFMIDDDGSVAGFWFPIVT